MTTTASASNQSAMLRALAAFSFCFLLALALASEARAQPVRVGVVDVQGAMNGTQHWKDAVAVLEKERAAKQVMLETKQRELKAKKDKIDAQKAVSDPKASLAEEEALVQTAQVLTQEFMQMQQELTAREQRVTDEMLTRIEVLVREIAINRDLTFVFEKGAPGAPNVLYNDPKTDITKEVSSLYQQRFKDKPLQAGT